MKPCKLDKCFDRTTKCTGHCGSMETKWYCYQICHILWKWRTTCYAVPISGVSPQQHAHLWRVKLSLPVDLLPQCHLFFTFRTRSSRDRASSSSKNENERPFAFAYFPLFTNNNAVQDGSHTLILYRMDQAGPMTPTEYFDAPPTRNGSNPLALNIPPSVARTAIPIKDGLVIRSLLCSTKYTHSKFLLDLLHWEEIPDPVELSNCLIKFTFIGEHEIVKSRQGFLI
jgi:hypothetical protein